MAIKFSCGKCGKKLATKDEHAGRRSKCPACGQEIEVPTPLPASAKASSQPEISEPVGSKPVGNRRVHRRLITTIACVGLITLMLVGIGFIMRPRQANPPAMVSSPSPQPAPAAPAPITITPAPTPPTRFDPAVIAQLASIYPARTARILFGKGDQVKEVKVLKSTVRRADPDRRKIDWLWEGDVSIMITQKTGEVIPVNMTMLFHLSPDGEEYECWRNVTLQIGTGITKRVHLKSPCKDWFQEQVSTEWNDLVERTEIGDVEELKDRLAYKYRVSIEEFDEILRPDP